MPSSAPHCLERRVRKALAGANATRSAANKRLNCHACLTCWCEFDSRTLLKAHLRKKRKHRLSRSETEKAKFVVSRIACGTVQSEEEAGALFMLANLTRVS